MTAPIVLMPCPSQEALAAFVDGRLSPEEHAEVISHLASCADCRDLVLLAIDFRKSEGGEMANEGGTFAMGAQVPPPNVVPFGKRILGYGGALAVAAAVVFAFLQYNRPGMDDLVAATAAWPERDIAPRLSADFPHHPLERTFRSAGTGTSAASEFDVKKAELYDLVQKLEKDRDLHRRGVALLLADYYDEAIGALEDAHAKSPDDVKIMLDLSAARIERGRKQGNKTDLERGLSLANDAWRREQRPEAAWNRAMALMNLDDHEKALRAWDDYLKIDSSSPWATEARENRKEAQESLEPLQVNP